MQSNVKREFKRIVNVITRKHLMEAQRLNPLAAKKIQAWYKIAVAARWRNFVDIRHTFQDADAVDDFVVFNIWRNTYRLLAIVHYSRMREERLTEGHIDIRSFLTHQQYNDRANWNKGVSS